MNVGCFGWVDPSHKLGRLQFPPPSPLLIRVINQKRCISLDRGRAIHLFAPGEGEKKLHTTHGLAQEM